jgi:hypothetical protein
MPPALPPAIVFLFFPVLVDPEVVFVGFKFREELTALVVD